MKEVSAVINGLTKEEISSLEKEKSLAKDGFDLVLEDVLISSEDVAGWAVATDGSITVALDITLTEELKREGFARDFVTGFKICGRIWASMSSTRSQLRLRLTEQY